MTANIKGLNVNYICEGKDDGDTVLLLHGWGSNITLFRDTVIAMSEKYRVIALDMPGFGESEEPKEPLDVDGYVDFVLEFLKLFSIDKLILLGHSFGGRVIIKMMNRENLDFKVTKIILVDSAGIKPKKTLKQKAKLRVYKMSKFILNSRFVKKFFPDAMDNLRKKNGSADYNNASPIMRACLVKVVNEDLTHLIPNINVPTLLIWGRYDDATPLSDGELMEKLIPDSGLVVLENCGHYSFLEQRNVYLRVIKSFLNIND